MGKLPNYRLRYSILLQMCKDKNLTTADLSDLSTTQLARENRASNNTIYYNLDAILRDLSDF